MRIGLLVQDIATEYSLRVVEGVKKYCLEHDIQLFVFIIRAKNWTAGIYDYQNYACKGLATKDNVDGLIIVTSTYCRFFPKDLHNKLIDELKYLPLVGVSEIFPDISSVAADMERTFYDLLTYLETEEKCRSIYFAGPDFPSDDIRVRFNTFRKFIKSKNRNPEERIINTDFTPEGSEAALARLNITKNNLPFDALVCCTDEVASGCMNYLKKQGIRIPEDVKITGIDNFLLCESLRPTLTSIDMGVEEQGYQAAGLLQKEIEHPDAEKQGLLIKPKIVYRESTGNFNKCDSVESSEGKYFQLREHVYRYQYFLQNLQIADDTKKLKNLIIESYKKFGIESCICCIYDSPKAYYVEEDFEIPERARVFFAYNQNGNYEFSSDIYLNPRESMIPEGFEFAPGKEIIVSAIFSYKLQYGYIIYTPGDMNYSTYELIMTTTGISLAANNKFLKRVFETERLSSEKKLLESETYFDEMTGVLNRRGLFKYGVTAIESAVERNLSGCVIFGDMDFLKRINDNFGHDAGDRAIAGEVEILRKVFRTHDIIARLGGDEFVIIACGLSVKTFFEKVKKRLKDTTEEYNRKHREPFKVSISLGYAEFSKDNFDLDLLINEADERLYEEKVINHRNRI